MLREHQRLGDFEIIRPLGKGGMGEVYEAQQGNPPRRVALKVLAAWLAEDEEALQRFWREAAVPAQLDHPSIVPIIASGRTDDGVAYYTMRLVRGPTLSQLIRAASQTPQPATVLEQTTSEHPRPAHSAAGEFVVEQPATAEDLLPELLQEYQRDRFGLAVRIGIQVGRALAAAHRVGVLHRDIKPSNLMIDGHRQVYVVDFGLTKALAGDGMATRPGVVCGTPWYMSPEQARNEPIDTRTDIFALGVTLYEMVTAGLGPYTASRQDGSEVLRQVRSGQVLPVRGLAPEVPAGLERVLRRALQFKASRRYQVAEEMVADLEREQEGLARPGPQRPRAALAWKRPASRALAGLLAVLAAIGLWWHFHPGAEPRPGAAPEQPGSADAATPPAAEAPPDAGPPLPVSLRDRPVHVPIALQRTDFQPLWSRHLCGRKGYCLVTPDGLNLFGPPKEFFTLFALDDDPKRRWFEFSIEVKQFRGSAGSGGIFFGWQTQATAAVRPFFLVAVQEAPDGAPTPGHFEVSIQALDEGRPQGGASQWSIPVPAGKGVVVLRDRPADGWQKVRVRAAGRRLSVSVGSASTTFDLPDFQGRLPPSVRAPDPRGALGIWAHERALFFRNATVVALPGDDESGPD
jgi:serine/threonine protein kinase